MNTPTRLLASSCSLALGLLAGVAQAQTPPIDEAAVRRIVEPLLAAKDAQIQRLENRVRELEQAALQAPRVEDLAAVGTAAPAPDAEPPVRRIALRLPEAEPDEEDAALEINGFFNVDARSENQDRQTFELGVMELDLNYSRGDHFAGSAALVWEDGGADLGPVFVDYHAFDDRVPARGRIFGADGYHLQAGRFDLPFATDYQYFARTDRIGVSLPFTTTRIQRGGFTSDGVRVYGTEGMLNYAAYWTNSTFEDDGYVGGGRLGLMFGRNPFRLHAEASAPVLEVGLSGLADMDREQDLRRAAWAADITLNYGVMRLDGEWAVIRNEDPLVDVVGIDYGEVDESAWHLTLTADLARFTQMPLRAFVRYESWDPDAPVVVDDEGLAWSADVVDRLALGLHYMWNDHLHLKLEYADSLGTHTDEPDFEHRLGTASLVGSF